LELSFGIFKSAETKQYEDSRLKWKEELVEFVYLAEESEQVSPFLLIDEIIPYLFAIVSSVLTI